MTDDPCRPRLRRRTAATPAASCDAADAGTTARLSGWVHRRRDHGQLIFIDLRDRHGLTQVVVDATEAPVAHEVASRVRTEFVVSVEGTVAARLAGTENPRLATGGIELRATTFAILAEAKTPPFYINEPDAPVDEILRLKYRYLDIRRRADGRAPAPAVAARPGDPRGPPRERLRRGRDADAHQEHARGSPRLHRPEPAPAGQRLRAAAEPAAAQAAPDGRRHGSLLPDRALLPRRGPARRPPARVHPARPRDELRRRGDGDGLRRVDGDRGDPGDRARIARSCRSRSRCFTYDEVARSIRVGQAGHPVRDGARRPRVRRWSTRTAPPPRASASSTRPSPPAAGSRRSWRPGWPARPGARSTSSPSVAKRFGAKGLAHLALEPGGEVKGPIVKFLSRRCRPGHRRAERGRGGRPRPDRR